MQWSRIIQIFHYLLVSRDVKGQFNHYFFKSLEIFTPQELFAHNNSSMLYVFYVSIESPSNTVH